MQLFAPERPTSRALSSRPPAADSDRDYVLENSSSSPSQSAGYRALRTRGSWICLRSDLGTVGPMGDDTARSHPLPDDPLLAGAARLLRDSGSWGWLVDDQWRIVFMTDELRRAVGRQGHLAPMPTGVVWGSTEWLQAQGSHLGGRYTADQHREQVSIAAPFMLADLPGGRDRLRELLAHGFDDLIDELEPDDSDMVVRSTTVPGVGGPVAVWYTGMRLRDATGCPVGWMWQSKPGVGMTTIAAMTSMGDTRHFERMMRASRPLRRPAAILMADLEGSSQLSRRLPTATYFALGRRPVRAADQ